MEEQSEFLITTTITNKKTKQVTSYYLEPNDSTLQVGHGMCSGAFMFKEGDEFEVSFDIMDASGNLTAWTEKR